MDNERIGKFIKELRINKGLSQKGIAEVCNVSHQAVSKWEKGESLPDLSSLKSLSSYYNVSIDEILAGEENKTKHNHKSNNNFNKEVIKLTMSFFVVFVAFLPFFNDGTKTFNGFEMVFDGEFGLGVMTVVSVFSYILFQLIFSIFTITRVISFSRGNVYLNRSVTVIMGVLVWFTITISALNPFPYIVYMIYIGSMYMVSTRVLQKIDMDTNYVDKHPRYEPYVYIVFYMIVVSVIPIYLVFFDEWFREVNVLALPVTVIIYVTSIIVFTYGFIKRKSNKDLSGYCKIISVHSIRLLYIIFLYLLYTESYFLDFSANSYDGIMYVIIYIGFDLLISSKYSQSLRSSKTVSLFK